MSVDRWLRILPLRLRSLVKRNDVERELDEELQYHVDQQTEENVRQGMSPNEAHAAALRAIGGVAFRKEQVRDTRGTRWIEELVGDVAFALRSLRRAPGFTATVVLTLALGIGANTAMFTLLRGTLLRPLPNRDGERLVYLRQASGAKQSSILFSVPEIADFRSGAKSFSAIAEYSSSVPFTLTTGDERPVRVTAGVISGNYFDVLGLDPVLGRLVNTGDDGPAAPPVADLSYEFWMEHFGGDPRVIGSTIRMNDKVTTIVGVLQRAPRYPGRTDVYVNTVASPHHLSATMVTERTHRMSEVFARLAPGATIEEARTEIDRIASGAVHDHPESYEKAARHQVILSSLKQAMNDRASFTFWLLMGAATFVLLIAFANVSNLTLMRGVGREREMLVRAALGAGSLRLRRLLIVENLVLTFAGGAIGVLVATSSLKMLVAFAAQLSPRAAEIRVDGVVLGVGLVTSIIVAIALSFVPRIGSQGNVVGSLTPAGRRTTLGRGRQRLQHSLVVTQVAVCVVLLTGAGLLVRTIAKLQGVETGVRADHVLTLELPLAGDIMRSIMNQPENVAKYEAIRDRVASLPGVEMSALSVVRPLRPSFMNFDIKAEGRPVAPNETTPHAGAKPVDAKYFAATGIPLIAGRNFNATDRRGSPLVVILGQSFAKQLFGSDDPIGRRVALTGQMLKLTPFSGEWRTVIGIAGDTRDEGLESGPTPAMYEPFAQELIPAGALVIRTTSDPSVMQATVVRTIRELYPRQMIENVATLESIRDATVAPRRLNALFIASFGALALLIAMVGIAGVLAFSVSSRTAEIGIRMSLGADAARVRRMVLGEGGILIVAGLFVGVSGALFATRVLQGLLFGITAHDPTTIVGVSFVLMAVGLVACWLPAARAARVDPAVALRAD